MKTNKLIPAMCVLLVFLAGSQIGCSTSKATSSSDSDTPGESYGYTNILEMLRKEPGLSSGFRRIKVPASTSSSQSLLYSSSLPSHQWILLGLQRASISLIQLISFWFVVLACGEVIYCLTPLLSYASLVAVSHHFWSGAFYSFLTVLSTARDHFEVKKGQFSGYPQGFGFYPRHFWMQGVKVVH